MKNKAIIVTSFGTSHEDAVQSCIEPVECAIRNAFPEYEVVRAFTSRMIARKLAREGRPVMNPTEAIAFLKENGVSEIKVASTHLIPGIEYDKLCGEAEGLPVSAPLLSDEADLIRMAEILNRIAEEEEGALLLMGHGTEHAANSTYAALREKLPAHILLACVEGSETLDTVMPRLEAFRDKTITLMPLMLVAGDHAKNDLGGDEPDSWRSQLTANGYKVRLRLSGMGSLEEVQQIFVEKLRKCM